MGHKIEGIIFDWAGTTVDYGCFAPLEVFLEVFQHRGIDLTLEEARGPMGMLKIDHIRALTKLERVERKWMELFGKKPDEEDVLEMYQEFEPSLLRILHGFTTLIPGVVETVEKLRGDGLKIGSTTGYTDRMMEIVVPGAKSNGYAPDFYCTPDRLPAGRPAPWMCYENAKALGIYPMYHFVKVGDTKSDIKEGVNAGCWSVGVMEGSSQLGMHQEEVLALTQEELEKKLYEVKEIFKEAGAHFVIKSMVELPEVIEKINGFLETGMTPAQYQK